MTPPPSSPADPAALRQQFLAHAGAAFDLMFHPEHQADLVSFDQREQRVHELMRDLGAWMLQRQCNADPLAVPPASQTVVCPRCHRPAAPLTTADDPLPARKLTTLTGEVELRRRQWRCKPCRLLFSPPR